MPYAAVNGQELYFEDTGETVATPGELAPTLVFSHGLLMDHSMFAPQIDAFMHRYRCIAWDERGHGKTAGAECAPFSYYDSANDLAALLAHLGVERAIFIGMSQGGYLSLRAALKHPKIVQALVLIDTQAMPENPAVMPGYEAMLKHWAANGLDEQTASTIEMIILGKDWPGAAVWKEKWATVQPHNLMQSFHTLGSRDDISDQLADIKIPVLVIHGDSDLAITPDRGKAMAAALPNARLELIAGAGHAANLTHPDQVNPLIEQFIAGLH
jgi:pimeloyl-ACP methyl ester carboxylesterase